MSAIDPELNAMRKERLMVASRSATAAAGVTTMIRRLIVTALAVVLPVIGYMGGTRLVKPCPMSHGSIVTSMPYPYGNKAAPRG